MYDATIATNCLAMPATDNEIISIRLHVAKARCTRYDLLYMIMLYITSRTVYTGVFRVACNIFQVYEIEHCSISFRVAYDFGILKQ